MPGQMRHWSRPLLGPVELELAYAGTNTAHTAGMSKFQDEVTHFYTVEVIHMIRMQLNSHDKIWHLY
jgi:hypothetical protein